MAEGIFNRISRLVSATVEDSVDRLEKAGGDAVMREAIREVDRATGKMKAERDAVAAQRLQAARQSKLLGERIEALGGKASFAVEAGRDELAEAVLSQQLDFEAQLAKLGTVQAEAREEEARLEEGMAALKARKSQMDDTLAAYTAARRNAAAGAGVGPGGTAGSDDAVEAAERAFERAMSGAVGLAATDAGTVSRVAEVEVLQRSAVIAERLATLKAQRAA